MHGIERTRKLQGSLEGNGKVTRIAVRYSDGRTVTFIPEGARKFFTVDDISELQKVLETASATAEWAEVTERGTM